MAHGQYGETVSPMVFLVEPDELAECAEGSTITVGGSEGRQGALVERLVPDEQVHLVDGRGRRATGLVLSADRISFKVQIMGVVQEPVPQPQMIVVQALAKGDRSQLAVEMLTESGVDVIIPWQAERCIARWIGDKSTRGRARWVAAAESATKKSRRSRMPEVHDLAYRAEVAAAIANSDLAIVLDESGGARLAHIAVPRSGSVCLVIGPEGGISPGEISAFVDAGALVARMGDSVLRTSTAGVVAASVVMTRSGRWD